ncbi:MAG: hypothetical protein AAGJ93_02570 [Bacteroidota bacterium]
MTNLRAIGSLQLPILALLLSLLLPLALTAQRLYPHPILRLLGTDLAEMGDTKVGLHAYDGIGSTDLLLTKSWQENRKVALSWIPLNGLPNGWGLLQTKTNTGRFVSWSGSDKGAYEGAANIYWNTRRRMQHSTFFNVQGNQRIADENEDGFRDQQAYSTYNFQHNLTVQTNDIDLQAYVQYFGQRQHGGELGYDWKQQAGSDSTYGFGSETNQWVAGVSAQESWRGGHQLHLNALWRIHREDAVYGQRNWLTQERRTGVAVHYSWEKESTLTHVYNFYQRQVLQQRWDGWAFNPNWDRFAWGGQHRRFLTSKLMVEAGLAIDYHTADRWKLLPNLRFDYSLHKQVRLGVIGGRNYRWQRASVALKPYLLSQRSFQQESYGPDRLWYVGGLLQTEPIKLGKWAFSTKTVYQARLLTKQLVLDPTDAPMVVLSHQSTAGPWQHLLLLTTQLQRENFTMGITYRWRDKPISTKHGTGQTFFEARHSLLAQVAYFKSINRTLRWWKLSTDYLLQSPLRLPTAEVSPYLHHWRCQLDLQWKNIRQSRWRPTTFVGVENLLNQKQAQLYASADQPFSQSFDGSNRWGDVVGRRWYMGVRVGF